MEKAYDFKLNDSEGNEVALHDFLGQKVVVYFLSQRQHAGLHEAGLQLPRSFHGTGRTKSQGDRHLQRLRDISSEIYR